MAKKINPDEMVPLKLTKAERNLILKDVSFLDDDYDGVIEATPLDQPVAFTLDDWEGLNGCIAAEANHTKDKKREKKLDKLFAKVEALCSQYTDQDEAPTLKLFGGEDDPTAAPPDKVVEGVKMLLSMADYMCHLQNVDAAALKSARDIEIALSDVERRTIIEDTAAVEELRGRIQLGGDKGLMVSIDDLVSLSLACSEAMRREPGNHDLIATAATLLRFLPKVLLEKVRSKPKGGRTKRQPK